MNELLNSKFISTLACPDCKCSIEEMSGILKCSNCKRNFEIRDGIPCLYPLNIDKEHLLAEESLAHMMKRTLLTRKDRFSSIQWNKSKNEFWQIVNNKIDHKRKSFINIGCGYDSSFLAHQKNGNLFINFDIVHKILCSLKYEHGAKFCVAGDINNLPFKKSSFDYVISIDVIHHQTDNLYFLVKSFNDLLKSGGTLFLEDPNAWGFFQAPKSILLPRPIYKFLRNVYHKIKQSSHRPADYEFPTSIWKVKKILKKLGFSDIVVYSNESYPCIGPIAFHFFKLFSGIKYIKRYHSYHYIISARKE